jgi:aminoglycoside phosphotransferase (APT) family kinase protein
VVGRVGAAIHGIDASGVRDTVQGHATVTDHRAAALDTFAGLPGAEAAAAWARAHLASAVPAVLLHGDLLGQNLLLWPGESPGVIDWEYASLGDPAYDLAIVTRGVRRPFQTADGLDRLLEAYAEAGGRALTKPDVYFHEIWLAAGWYREALAGTTSEPPDQAHRRLFAILERAEAGQD